MNLHHAAKKADWETIPASSRTRLQKIAAKTNGIIAPANGITLVGLCVVFYGLWAILQGEFLYGLVALVGGRLLDIVDGVVADVTATKSSVGELLDAGSDKLCTLATMVVVVVANVVTWWVIVVLLLPQLAIIGVTAYQKRRHHSLHPAQSGKISMALLWVGCIGLIAARYFSYESALLAGSYLCVAVSVILGWLTVWRYSRVSK